MCELELLSQLIKEKSKIEDKISTISGRPALIGHTGEYIASVVFDIQLEKSATTSGYDGRFTKGELKGKTVNVKWYAKNERVLDIREEYLPEYYLVLTGPDSAAEASRNKTRPWLIYSVFLFNASKTVIKLKSRGIRIGAATSILKEYWDCAEVYPLQRNNDLQLSSKQRDMLGLFRD